MRTIERNKAVIRLFEDELGYEAERHWLQGFYAVLVVDRADGCSVVVDDDVADAFERQFPEKRAA